MSDRIFVGRQAERKRFMQILARPEGQAVVVVGQAGMGKTWLVNKLAQIAEEHPDFKCGTVRYEVTPTDSVDSTMALMMDHAFEAGRVEEGSFSGTGRKLEQWRSFLNVFNLGDLAMSLRRDPAKATRDQFLDRLHLISKKIPENGRAVFIIDPEKYMMKDSDQAWALVAKGLPDKVKLIFAQRPGDVLVGSETFWHSDNAVRLGDDDLGVLDEGAVDELLNVRAGESEYDEQQLRRVLGRYEGYPYALGAALDLIRDGARLEELPDRPEPTEFAAAQWKKIGKKGGNAVRLFEAYAVLEVGVPDEVVEEVSGVDSVLRKSLMADGFVSGLLRDEGEGRRIYHAILAEFVLGQISDKYKKVYHERAVGYYRERLAEAKEKQTKPDGLAAMRLAEHVLVTEGEDAFLLAFIDECFPILKTLGLYDLAIDLSQRALAIVEKSSVKEAAFLCNLGVIYRKRGELDKAEEMHKKALWIMEKHGLLKGMASEYGNLGLLYVDRGELDKAKEMYIKALEISEPKGMMELMANQYGNLGIIYGKRGKSDKAEEMFEKSLAINEKLDRLEGMADNYGNLGAVYDARGDKKEAREYWEKAVGLCKQMGMPHMVEKIEGWIAELGEG